MIDLRRACGPRASVVRRSPFTRIFENLHAALLVSEEWVGGNDGSRALRLLQTDVRGWRWERDAAATAIRPFGNACRKTPF